MMPVIYDFDRSIKHRTDIDHTVINNDSMKNSRLYPALHKYVNDTYGGRKDMFHVLFALFFIKLNIHKGVPEKGNLQRLINWILGDSMMEGVAGRNDKWGRIYKSGKYSYDLTNSFHPWMEDGAPWKTVPNIKTPTQIISDANVFVDHLKNLRNGFVHIITSDEFDLDDLMYLPHMYHLPSVEYVSNKRSMLSHEESAAVLEQLVK